MRSDLPSPPGTSSDRPQIPTEKHQGGERAIFAWQPSSPLPSRVVRGEGEGKETVRNRRFPTVSGVRRLYAPLTCLLTMAICAFAAPQPLAHWPMEGIEQGVVTDVSGHGYDAAAYGKDGVLPEVVEGIVSKALRFSAEDEQYLQVQKLEGLAAPEAFTVMAWIRPAKRAATYGIIGNKGDKSGDPPWPGWRFRYFWTRVVLQFGAADGQEPSISSENWSVMHGFWSHVAATYDGDKLALYVDCNLVASREVNAQIMPGRRQFVIGNYVGRKNAYAFDGIVDELKVFDTALTEDEIFAEATRGMTE